jgi:3-deoxy-D-manno-octulosonic-acid transferase
VEEFYTKKKSQKKRLNLSLFSFIYAFVATIAYILALPYLLYKRGQKKYQQAIPAKFFLKNNPRFNPNGIWFHCCSFGEVRALKPICEKINEPICISVMTNTGFEEAKALTNSVRYLPFEIFLPFWIRPQKALFVVEAELWYMLFLCAKAKKIPTYLINARISSRSYASYLRFSFLYKHIFKHIDKVFAQSHEDKVRLESLGAKSVEVIGNIKLAQLPHVSKKLEKPQGFTLTAASTHENEEALVLGAYEKSMGRLIVVPRHPERFDKVHTLLSNFAQKNRLSYSRYSLSNSLNEQIVLVDKMGELNNIYAISDAVILGGAFEKIGGHNPVEPAFFNCKIISGEHIFNQKPLFEAINDYTIVKNEDLKKAMQQVQTLKKASLSYVGDIAPIIKEIHGL